MARITYKERYIQQLLFLCKRITEQICNEIGEAFHDRERSVAEMKDSLVYLIEDELDRFQYREDLVLKKKQ